MYCSLDKLDFVIEDAGRRIAVQTDHRSATEIEEAWAESVVYAAVRARNALHGGHAIAVRFVCAQEPPARYVTLLQQLGAEVEIGVGGGRTAPAPDEAAEKRAVEEALLTLGAQAFAEHGLAPDVAGLEELEDALLDAKEGGPDSEFSVQFWGLVVRLCGAAARVMRDTNGGALHPDTDLHGVIPYRWSLDGTLVNLFGRAHSFLHDDPSVRPSQLVKMGNAAQSSADDGDVMFHFRPHGWEGVSVALTVPLLENLERAGDHTLPIVAIVIDLPTATKTIPRDTPPDRVAALRAEAAANVRKREIQIQQVDVADAPLLVVHGDFYAAERLLDPDFMRGLHTRLGAEILLAGVPAKGLLIVQNGLGGPERTLGFMNVVKGQFDRARPNDRLSTEVLLVTGGNVVGLARAKEPEPPPKKKGFWSRLFGGGDN